MALPEIANPTIAQLHSIVNENIANDVVGGIDPADIRAVDNSVVNYLANINSNVLKTKVIVLTTFTIDRHFSIPTTIVDGSFIRSVDATLICKVANNNFVIGDIVKPPSPYVNGGIGIQYKENDVTSVKAVVNDEVWILNAYSATPGALGSNLQINPAQWSIRLTILYV
jgi:hypothetical protein